MTMTQGEMLTKLYDEVIKQLSAVKQFNESKDYAAANLASQKAQRILHHLNATLDFQYDVSKNLSTLRIFHSSARASQSVQNQRACR